MQRIAGVVLLGVLATVAASPLQAEGTSVSLLAGQFNNGKTPTEAEVGVELQWAPRAWKLRPAAGVSTNEEGAVWGWVGAVRDFELAPRWAVSPGFALAFYDEGKSKDLGGPLEFRSSLALAYRVSARTRVGAAIYHLSNAGIEEPNPGANSVVVTLSFDLGR